MEDCIISKTLNKESEPLGLLSRPAHINDCVSGDECLSLKSHDLRSGGGSLPPLYVLYHSKKRVSMLFAMCRFIKCKLKGRESPGGLGRCCFLFGCGDRVLWPRIPVNVAAHLLLRDL